jgi:hypothetical protein
MDVKYVHTLLFACPQCKLPVAVTRISEKRNLEAVATETVSMQCSFCAAVFETVGANAKIHFVDEWTYKNLP